MEEVGTDINLIVALEALYEDKQMAIRMGQKITKTFQTTKGLLQGCSISPPLFKIYLKHMLKQWKRKFQGIRGPVRGEHTYTLSFADDQVVTAQD